MNFRLILRSGVLIEDLLLALPTLALSIPTRLLRIDKGSEFDGESEEAANRGFTRSPKLGFAGGVEIFFCGSLTECHRSGGVCSCLFIW